MVENLVFNYTPKLIPIKKKVQKLQFGLLLHISQSIFEISSVKSCYWKHFDFQLKQYKTSLTQEKKHI